MQEQKQDRRIRRTQKLLKDSLIELMQEKEFKNITVKDITERADLNRGTFYLHYNDTYHLLQDIEEGVLSDFQEMIDSYKHSFRSNSLLPILYPVIDYIGDNAPICHILFENNASHDFLVRFHSLIHNNGRTIILSMFPIAEEEKMNCFFEFVTYGLIGMLKQWVDSGQKLARKTLAELADKSIIGVAEGLLK